MSGGYCQCSWCGIRVLFSSDKQQLPRIPGYRCSAWPELCSLVVHNCDSSDWETVVWNMEEGILSRFFLSWKYFVSGDELLMSY